MTHIFISYSRRDREYARKLVDDLLARGFDVWFDERITYGANWEQAIFKAIDTCAVLVVLMSPDAAASEWVPREIAYAEQRRKPIFPLLLAGEVFPRLILMQYADVTNRALPPDAFYQTISTFAPPGADAGTLISTAEPGQSQTSRPAETVTRERRLESAMPRQSQRGVPTEVRVKVSLLDSAGLRGELPDLTEYGDEIKKGDVRASGFPLAFPLDYDGRALPVDACILVSADRYRVRYPTNPCGEDGAEVQIPPDHDSRTVIFTLEPLDNAYTGRAAVTVRLMREGRVIAENQVVTRVVADIMSGAVAYMLASAGADLGMPGVDAHPAPPVEAGYAPAAPAPSMSGAREDAPSPAAQMPSAPAVPAPAPVLPRPAARTSGGATLWRYGGLVGIFLAALVGVLALNMQNAARPPINNAAPQTTVVIGVSNTQMPVMMTMSPSGPVSNPSQPNTGAPSGVLRGVIDPPDGSPAVLNVLVGNPSDGFTEEGVIRVGERVTVLSRAEIEGSWLYELLTTSGRTVWLSGRAVRLAQGVSEEDVPVWTE